MAERLVTLGTYHNAIQAQYAVNRLKEAGIAAYLADENIVSMDFLLGNAVGWIKVQVREPDLERAEAVLADPADPVAEEEIPWDDAEAAADDEEKAQLEETIAEQKATPVKPEEPVGHGDKLITMAYRLAVFGVIFFPLNVISLVSLLYIALLISDISPRANRLFNVSLLINLVILTFWGILFCGGGWAAFS